MAIKQDPRRVPNAGLGMIDFSTTARLGEKGTDLVTEAVMNKQKEQKLKFEQARLDEKNARIAQGQWQGMAQNTPELLTFYEEAGGEVSKAFERSQNGRSTLTDNLILQGAGQNFVTSKKEQQASQLAELQTQQIIDQNIEKEAVGKAMAKSYVKDEDGNITFDANEGATFLQENAPQYMGTFATEAGNINAQEAQIQSIKDKDAIAYANAQSKLLESQTKNIKYKQEQTNLNSTKSVTTLASNYLENTGKPLPRDKATELYNSLGGNDIVGFLKMLDDGAEAGLYEKSASDKQEEKNLVEQQNLLASSAVSDSITKTLTAITKTDEILDNIGRKSSTEGSFFNLSNVLDVGPLGHFTSGALQVQADIEVITGNLTLEKIAEMKKQSETGATGLGQVSIPEFTTLGSSIEDLKGARVGGGQFLAERLENVVYARGRLTIALFEAYCQKYGLTEEEAVERLPVGSLSYSDLKTKLDKMEKQSDRFADTHGGSYKTILKENKNYYPNESLKNSPKPQPAPTPAPAPADPNAVPPMLSYGQGGSQQGSGGSRFTINSYPSN